MMESTERTQDADDARRALADLDASKNVLVERVVYPPGYLALATVAGALLPLATSGGAEDAPVAWRVVAWVGFVAGIALSAAALSRFRAANSVRVSGFRYGRGLAATYLVVILVLIVGAGVVASSTSAWWIGFALVPVSGIAAYAYQRRWLTTFQRQARR